MHETSASAFLDFSVKKLRQLTDRIEDCLGKLSEEQIWMRGGEEQNAAGNLVLHLCGNLRQWVVGAIGGQPDIRQRGGVTGPELIVRLRQVVEEAAGVIQAIPPDRLTERIAVQKYEVTVLEAVYHVVEHFSQHTGQILFVTKFFTGKDLGYYQHLRAAAHKEPTP